MAILYFTGFENYNGTGSLFSFEPAVTTLGTAIASVTTPVRFSNRAVRFNPVTTAIAGVTLATLSTQGLVAAANVNNAYARFDFYVETLPILNSEPLFQFYNGANAKLELRINSGGFLSIWESNGTNFVSLSVAPLSINTWYQIEVRGGNGAAAAYEVRVDGIAVLSGTANQGATAVQGCNLGKAVNRNGNSLSFVYDNFAWSDTGFIGGAAVLDCESKANGGSLGWTAAANAWELVRDPENSDFIASPVAAGTKLQSVIIQNATDLGIVVSDIKAFKALARIAEVSSTNTNFSLGLFGVAPVQTVAYNGTITITSLQIMTEIDPNTGLAFVPAGMDGSRQIWVVENSSFSQRCYQIKGSYLLNYTEASDSQRLLALLGVGL